MITFGKSKQARRRQAGFTLVELLVVLVILGLIVAFAAPQVIKYVGGAKSDSANIQVGRISGVLDLYRLEVGRYPTQDEGLDALIEQPPGAEAWNGPYLKKADALKDPWGRTTCTDIRGNTANTTCFPWVPMVRKAARGRTAT